MRTRMVGLGGALGVAIGATWSVGAAAQLAPPPPMQAPPPGSTWNAPQQPPAWGMPQQPPAWGAPQQPGYGQPPPSATQQQLNAADNAKSFRGLEIGYANAEVGGSLMSFGSSAGGAMFGVGGGVRFVTWTLGLRARVHLLSDSLTAVQANAEVGFHLPTGAWDPYVHVHGGYLNVSAHGASSSGGNVGGAVGADYYFTALLSLGLDVSADALFVSTTGFGLAGSLHLGLHFDL